jgi:8-oxo-dGTP pyrophosphatase MutT (NUDIX family)
MDIVFKNEKSVFNYRVAAIWIEKGHVLIHRSATDSTWSLPGGRVEMMEDSQASVVREIKEELGIEVQVDQLVWSVENFFEYSGHNFHEIGFYYKISPVNDVTYFKDGDFHGNEGERLVYRWVAIEEIDQIELYPQFLREELKNIPANPQHIVVRQ